MRVERDTCYVTSMPRATLLTSTEVNALEPSSQEDRSTSPDNGRDQSVAEDQRRFSINFLGLLDSRKTVLAIAKRRATINFTSTDTMLVVSKQNVQSGETEKEVIDDGLRGSGQTSRQSIN